MAYWELLANSTPIFEANPYPDFGAIGTPRPHRPSSVDMEWELIRIELKKLDKQKTQFRKRLYPTPKSPSSAESASSISQPSTVVRASGSSPLVAYSTNHTSPLEALVGSKELPDSQHQSSSSGEAVEQDEVNDTTNTIQQHGGPSSMATAMDRWLQQGGYEFQPQGQGNFSSAAADADITSPQNGLNGGNFGAWSDVHDDVHWYHNTINDLVSTERKTEATELQMEIEERLWQKRQAKRWQQRHRR
ncbi:MAG: hypothetical protein LQ351_004121 [Letrouitia transgressa]|nr:MAG: hypothetical protein LQ351_004121 [Letrouitia transgressa]